MEGNMDGTFKIDATVADRVREIVALHTQRDLNDVALTDTISDLGLDSLGVVELIFALEETFEISMPFNANHPDQRTFALSTLGSLVEAVEGVIAAQ